MSADHAQALAPHRIRLTWHPASRDWVPRKWWHPLFLVTPCKPPDGLVLQNQIVETRKSVALRSDGARWRRIFIQQTRELYG
jgi:hypothetical protein